MKTNLSFAVISDIHNDSDSFAAAVADLGLSVPGLAALVINGDFLDLGHEENYARFRRDLDAVSALLPPKLIINIGNHEFYPDYGTGPNDSRAERLFLDRYLAFARRDEVYAEDWIEGYHFLSLGSESSYNDFYDDNTVRANLFAAQLAWLKKKLAEGREKGKPIFVFLHQPLDLTYPATRYYGDNVAPEAEVRAALDAVPEVLLFTSHTHSTWYLPNRNVWRSPAGFTAIDSGSVAQPTFIDDTLGLEKVWGKGTSEGLVVSVFDDRTIVEARDFNSRNWIPGSKVVVPILDPVRKTPI